MTPTRPTCPPLTALTEQLSHVCWELTGKLSPLCSTGHLWLASLHGYMNGVAAGLQPKLCGATTKMSDQ